MALVVLIDFPGLSLDSIYGLCAGSRKPEYGTSEWLPSFSWARLRRNLDPDTKNIAVARIPTQDLNCVFYLYPNESSARDGLKLGGTGFWLSVPSQKVPNYLWLFAVSNRHVVQRGGASVIRANDRDGGVRLFQTEPTDWIEHPDGHDIAVLPMVSSRVLPFIDCMSISSQMFVIEQHLKDETVGIGDDVYMIGRFINHEGKQRNMPSVRFGNISMLPGEPIYIDKNTKPQESFAIELRSMCGYSGSPVFVEVGGIQRRDDEISTSPPQQLFLGVHWGHINEPWAVEKRIIKSAQRTGLGPGEKEIDLVSANTGMNGVVPAWRLMEILNLPTIREIQCRDEEMELEERKRDNYGARLDSAISDAVGSDPPATDENPNHLEDFRRLVDVAARKRQQDDQT
jgi:hypothetical protein